MENPGELPSAYQTYTILDAMRSIYNGSASDPNNGYSIFDLYATLDAKKLMVDWITSNSVPPGMSVAAGTNPQSAQQGAPTMREGVSQVGGGNAKPGATYYILTIARGTDTTGQEPVDTIYSFRALPFVITDREPPQLTNITGDISVGETSGTLLGGNIVLTFDKRLYMSDSTTLIETKQQFFPGTSTGVDTVKIIQGAEATTVAITLTESKSGLLAVVPAGYLYNSGGSPAPQSLRIQMVRRQINSGTPMGETKPVYAYYLEVEWSTGETPDTGRRYYEKMATFG